MKSKSIINLAFSIIICIFIFSNNAFSNQDLDDTISTMLSNIKLLNLTDNQLSKIENTNLSFKYDDSLGALLYSKQNTIIGLDSTRRETVFLRYFLDKAKYFDAIIRYLSSISEIEILNEEPEFYIWKNKEENYFVLQISKDTCIFTELVLGYFLKYYAKYLE